MTLKKHLYIVVILFSLLLIQTACSKSTIAPARQTPHKTKPDPDKDTDDKTKPTITCEKKWEELMTLSPKGLETSHQELQTMKIKDEITILSQSITEKVITENNGTLLEWRKDIKILAPEEGTSSSNYSIKKETYLNLCSKNINLPYTDRPTALKPTEKKSAILTRGENEYDVDDELYDLSGSTDPVDKDYLELWIGSKEPYKNILFKSKRTYFKSVSSQLATITITKELITFNAVEK